MTGSGDSFTSSVVAGGGGGAITVFAGVAPELLFEATLDSVGLGKLVEAVTFGALVGCGLGVATNADAFVAEILPGGWVFETVCAADIVRQLSLHLDALQGKVLMSLVEGHGVNETAERFGIHRRTVLNYRKAIVAAASQIGLAE